MNPDEGIWDVLKDNRLANYCPTSLEELDRTVQREIRRVKGDPREVRTTTRQTELPIHELAPARPPHEKRPAPRASRGNSSRMCTTTRKCTASPSENEIAAFFGVYGPSAHQIILRF